MLLTISSLDNIDVGDINVIIIIIIIVAYSIHDLPFLMRNELIPIEFLSPYG